MLVRSVCLATLLLSWSVAAEAAVEIEASAQGRPLRLVIDRDQDRVLIQNGGAESLVDLAKGDVYRSESGGGATHVRAWYRPGHTEPPPYRLEPFSPGPMVAGHASRYYVLFVDDRVCAEILVSRWMRPFIDPAIQAMTLVDGLAAGADADPCTAIPFATLAAAGWPLLVGKIDQPTFETTSIRFDYQPKPEELALPARFVAPPAAPERPPSGS